MSQTIQASCGLNTRRLCDQLDLSYGTLLRWRRRAANGLPLLARPGPKKIGALPLEELRREMEELVHGQKRSAGSGTLISRYQHSISRRDLTRLIAHERKTLNEQRRLQWKRVTWKHSNLAWGIDATEYGKDQSGRKLFLIIATDLASRYCFEPLVTLSPCAEDVARHLQKLFRRHGLPLLLKRDNGSIFNNRSVDALLAGACVIPLNSPAYYPPYNGGIEKGIRELKEAIRGCLPEVPRTWEPQAVSRFANAAAHLRNCVTRRSLGRRSAAEAYHHAARRRFGKQERHTIFEWIKTRSNETMQKMDTRDHRSTHAAWRHATETWLRCQNLITVSANQKVLPH